MLTIFTPTYNRAYIIGQLYESLCRQSNNDFEWLIVDDGSTDDIEPLVNSFINEGKIDIRFLRQQNAGKHAAINRGVAEARGEWFFIVDSDDYLTDDAVDWVNRTATEIGDDNRFAGLSGIRVTPEGAKIGGDSDFGTIDSTAIDIRLRYGVAGDLAEVYRTSVLKQFPFPVFPGERFCPEALVWFRIARAGKMLRYVHHPTYVCEYRPDGLTAKITKLRRNSPCASMTFYSEHFHDKMPLMWRLKAAINYHRFALAPYRKKYNMKSPLAFLGWLPGKLMQINDKKNSK